MIRSGIGTDPEVLRHHPLAQRVVGAECRDQFSRPFSSREKYFLLTFPLIEPKGCRFESYLRSQTKLLN
jgi:hypothetical protein